MYIINKLEYEKQNNEWKHNSTRLIKTFSERKHAEQYLENCFNQTLNSKQKEEYKLEKVGI